MEFLRAKLGDKFDEFMELIGDTKLVEDDGKLIPYSRFKEVNDKKNELQDKLAEVNIQLDELEQKYLSQEELEKKKREQIEADNRELNLRFNKSQLETMFVSADIEEDDYRDILENVVTDDFEQSKVIVENMINVISKQKQKVMEKAKIDGLDDTPTPQGGQPDKKLKFSDFGDDFVGASEAYSKNPDAFELE